jgi:hypothetical protein
LGKILRLDVSFSKPERQEALIMTGNNQVRVNGRFPPCKFTPQEAFEVYRTLPENRRTVLAHEEAMAKAGKPIGHDTLAKWRKKYNWDTRLTQNGVLQVGDAAEIFQALEQSAEKFTSKVIKGLMGQLVARVQIAVPTLPCASIGEAKDIVSLAESVQALYERNERMDQSSKTTSDDHELPDFRRPFTMPE